MRENGQKEDPVTVFGLARLRGTCTVPSPPGVRPPSRNAGRRTGSLSGASTSRGPLGRRHHTEPTGRKEGTDDRSRDPAQHPAQAGKRSKEQVLKLKKVLRPPRRTTGGFMPSRRLPGCSTFSEKGKQRDRNPNEGLTRFKSPPWSQGHYRTLCPRQGQG